jgi:hypothetical protein
MNNTITSSSSSSSPKEKKQPDVPVHDGLWDIVSPVVNLVTNAAIKGTTLATQSAAKALNIDITKNDLPEALEKVSAVIGNPETQAKVRKIAGELATDALVIGEAAGPAFKKTAQSMVETGIELGKKEGKALISAGLDIAGTIPVAGEILEGVRVVSDVVKAGEAVADATAKTVEETADGMNQTIQNLEDLKQAGTELTNPFTERIPNLQGLQKEGISAQNRAESAIKLANRTDSAGAGAAAVGGSKRKTRRHHKKRFKSILKSKKSTNGRLKNKTRKHKSKRVRFFAL